MDKPAAIQLIARRLAPRIARELTWAQFASAVTSLDDAAKAGILAAVRTQDARALGDRLLDPVRAFVRTQAVTDATTMLADDAISLTELDRVV